MTSLKREATKAPMVMRSLHRPNGGDIRDLCSQMLDDKRLILVGNRGRVQHRFDEDGEIE